MKKTLLPIVFLCASLQFLRYYVFAPVFYLRLPDYFSGHERLPYQYRVLPILFLKPLHGVHFIQNFAATRIGPMHDPDRIDFFLLSCLAFIPIYYFTVKLYRELSPTRRLEFLLFPTLLFVLIWTYIIHLEQNFSYPYDLPSLAFFTAGIFYIYKRRFLPLFLIVLIGTFNRETTLFLIGIYVLDAITVGTAPSDAPLRARFNLRQIPWFRVALLSAIWIAIKLGLFHLFGGNDRSEDYNRLHENLLRIFHPNYWPGALNLGGYLLPFILIFRNRIADRRFVQYLYILIPWVLIIFRTGIILETRVYGELSCYIAIYAVLLLETYIATTPEKVPLASRT